MICYELPPFGIFSAMAASDNNEQNCSSGGYAGWMLYQVLFTLREKYGH